MKRQTQILRTFKMDYDLILTKQQIIKIAELDYYHNTRKWVGDILTRMVNNGSIIRVSRGHYRLGKINQNKTEIHPKNQTSIDF